MSVHSHGLRLDLTVRAQADFRSLLTYSLLQWGADQSTDYEEAIQHTLDTLCGQPALGRARDDLRPGLRSHPVLRHVIFYRIEGESLIVQRIVHGRMDAKGALSP